MKGPLHSIYFPSRLLLGIGLLSLHLPAWSADPIQIAMTADRWQTEGDAAFQQYKGVDALVLKKGVAVVNGLTFRNGTIEFDVEPLAMGAGIGFRRRDKDTYEDFYLRPVEKCSEAPFCMQYAPQTHGVLLWDLFPQYQSPAPVHEHEWNHLKLVVSGRRMNIFVNGAQSPTLKIGRLEGDTLEGGLLLQAPGYFANLTVTPDAVEGLAAEPEKDPAADDPRFVRNWRLARAYDLPAGKEPILADLPDPSKFWQMVVAEGGGLINISRQYGQPLPPPGRSVTWLKTTITSDQDQMKKTAIGWSREIWLFVNGHLVYADKNLYQNPIAGKMAGGKTPSGRCSEENGSFLLPLKAGDNEVVVALANNFYGWGLILHLDDVEGIHVARQ